MAWNEAVVTNKGIALLRQSFENGSKVSFAKAVVGNTYSETTSLLAMSEIPSPIQEFPISRVDSADKNIRVSVRIDNRNNTEEYTIRQVGLYAQAAANEQVLFAVIQDPLGEVIPSIKQNPEYLVEFDYLIPVSNVDNIQMYLNSEQYVTNDEFQSALNEKTSVGHGHQIFDILDLQGTLNSLEQSISEKASGSHVHQISDVSWLQNELNGKAPYEHKHTALESAINSKQDSLGYVPVQQSGGKDQLDNKVYIGWSGSSLKAQVDATDMGNIITDGAANNSILPISKGGTGATSASAAESKIMPVSTITDKSVVLRNISSYCTPTSVSFKKIGKRVNATLIFGNATSAADCKLQVVQLASAYTPKGVHVGIVNVITLREGKYSRGCGYINVSEGNGIITLVLPSASTTYQTIEVFLDYYLG